MPNDKYQTEEMDIKHQRLLEVKLLLRPKEAAEILRVCQRVVYYMCDDGTLDCVKVRGSIRIKTESVRRLLENEAEDGRQPDRARRNPQTA